MPPKRKSKKRDAIYDLLRSTKAHPTAEWIYATLKEEIPDLSLGTVYRNLAMFKEENQAVCVATVNGQERFDGNTDPHAHFICRGCGSVIDVDMGDVKVPHPEGLGAIIDGYQLNYYGVCRDCQKNATA